MLVIFRAELIFEYELGVGWGVISITLRCSIAVYQNILIGCYLFEN